MAFLWYGPSIEDHHPLLVKLGVEVEMTGLLRPHQNTLCTAQGAWPY
jgi:hypothetical protein